MFADRYKANSNTEQPLKLSWTVVLSTVVLLLALLPAVLPAPSGVQEALGPKAADQIVRAEHGLLSSHEQLRALRRMGDPVLVLDPLGAPLIPVSSYFPLVLASAVAFLLAGFAICSLRRISIRQDAARAPPCGPFVR